MIQFVSGVRVVLGVASCARPVPQREQGQTTVSPVGILANSWKLTAITSRPSVKLINAFILAPANEVLRQRNFNALCIHHVATANASIPSPPPIPTPLILMKLRTHLYMQERAAAVPEQLEPR